MLSYRFLCQHCFHSGILYTSKAKNLPWQERVVLDGAVLIPRRRSVDEVVSHLPSRVGEDSKAAGGEGNNCIRKRLLISAAAVLTCCFS